RGLAGAPENSRATPRMCWDRGLVSSYIRPRCGTGSTRTAATPRATSAAATGEVLPGPTQRVCGVPPKRFSLATDQDPGRVASAGSCDKSPPPASQEAGRVSRPASQEWQE